LEPQSHLLGLSRRSSRRCLRPVSRSSHAQLALSHARAALLRFRSTRLLETHRRFRLTTLDSAMPGGLPEHSGSRLLSNPRPFVKNKTDSRNALLCLKLIVSKDSMAVSTCAYLGCIIVRCTFARALTSFCVIIWGLGACLIFFDFLIFLLPALSTGFHLGFSTFPPVHLLCRFITPCFPRARRQIVGLVLHTSRFLNVFCGWPLWE